MTQESAQCGLAIIGMFGAFMMATYPGESIPWVSRTVYAVCGLCILPGFLHLFITAVIG